MIEILFYLFLFFPSRESNQRIEIESVEPVTISAPCPVDAKKYRLHCPE